eukprot:gene23211-175_t
MQAYCPAGKTHEQAAYPAVNVNPALDQATINSRAGGVVEKLMSHWEYKLDQVTETISAANVNDNDYVKSTIDRLAPYKKKSYFLLMGEYRYADASTGSCAQQDSSYELTSCCPATQPVEHPRKMFTPPPPGPAEAVRPVMLFCGLVNEPYIWPAALLVAPQSNLDAENVSSGPAVQSPAESYTPESELPGQPSWPNIQVVETTYSWLFNPFLLSAARIVDPPCPCWRPSASHECVGPWPRTRCPGYCPSRQSFAQLPYCAAVEQWVSPKDAARRTTHNARTMRLFFGRADPFNFNPGHKCGLTMGSLTQH